MQVYGQATGSGRKGIGVKLRLKILFMPVFQHFVCFGVLQYGLFECMSLDNCIGPECLYVVILMLL